MIKLQVSSNLARLQDQLNNVHNNIQEMIARCLNDSIDEMKNELKITFGGAIDYANFTMNFDGENFSLNVSDLNEFVLYNNSGATAQSVLDQAVVFLSAKIQETLARENVLGGI